jgi:hypothetical protein
LPVFLQPFEMELDSFMDRGENLVARFANRDAPGKIGNVRPKGRGPFFNYNEITHLVTPILESSLLQSIVQSTGRNINARLPRDRNRSMLLRMMKLAVTALADLEPTVGF